jgi:oligosaccharide repeat unit polymerase
VSPDDLLALAGGALLILAHAIPWMLANTPPLVNSPIKLASFLSGFQVIPHYFIVFLMPQESLLFPIFGDQLNTILPKFALYYSISQVSLLAGISIFSKGRRKSAIASLEIRQNYYVSSAIAFFTYLFSMYLIAENSGGIASFIQNSGNQKEFEVGNGIYYIIKIPAAYLSILFLSVNHARTGKPSMAVLLFFVILVVGIESTLGSRRTPIQLIAFFVIAIYMIKPNVKLITLSNVALGTVSVIVFVALLSIRDQNSAINEQRTFWSYLTNMSYNDMYIFVLHHFSNNDLWYGKVFLDIKYRFTGGLDGLPPPSLDEGVYIYNLFIGRAVEPPLPLELMAHNSWPPRTFGNGYLNFGLFGIVGFSFLQGVITGKLFKLMKDSFYNPVFIFLYLMGIFSFQISNLKFTEMMIVLVGLMVMFGPIALMGNLTSDVRLTGGGRGRG